MRHIIDKNFFFEAVEEFAYNYNIYYKSQGDEIDDYGRNIPSYKKDIIRGSFQTNGISISRKNSGNTQSETAKFYCMNIYRININDIVERYGNYYIVTNIHNYDEWGVREAELTMKALSEIRDFNDWLKVKNGGLII